ncbi:hypothetical protein ES703_81029 [subsurface metagenome]
MPKRAIDLKLPITTTQREVLPENPGRIYSLLVNDGAADLYLGMGTPAVQNRGIRVNNGGGSYEINLMNPWHGSISAVSSGTPDLLIVGW